MEEKKWEIEIDKTDVSVTSKLKAGAVRVHNESNELRTNRTDKTNITKTLKWFKKKMK